MVMGMSCHGIHVPYDMLFGIPRHAIVLRENGSCVVGRVGLPSYLFWIGRPGINVSRALCFSGL